MKFKLILLVTSIVLLSCDNSLENDGPIPTEPNTVFTLNNSDSYNNYYFSLNLTGKDNNGNKFNSSSTESSGQEIIFNGEIVTPITSYSVLDNITTGHKTITSSVSYLVISEEGTTLVGYFTNGKIYKVTERETVPHKAKLGDSGSIGVFVDEDGNTISGTWGLNDNWDNTAFLTEVLTFKDKSGNITNTVQSSPIIDVNGNTLFTTIYILESITTHLGLPVTYNNITLKSGWL